MQTNVKYTWFFYLSKNFLKDEYEKKRNINITLGYKANTENNLNATILLVAKCKT